MHFMAAAVITPSGVPPMPSRMSAPESGHAVEMAPATSPSGMSRMRAPASRTSAMIASWRGRSRMTAVTSRTLSPLALATAVEVLGDRHVQVDDADALRADRDLLHVDARARVEHRAPLGHRDDGDGAAAAEGGERGAVDGVDGDVGEHRGAVADPLAVEEHRRLVLLALADDDDPVHRHGVEHDPHGVDGGAVGAVLVAPPHPPARRQRRRLGGAHELQGEVPVGALLLRHGSET